MAYIWLMIDAFTAGEDFSRSMPVQSCKAVRLALRGGGLEAIQDRILAIEHEMSRTQKNKATEGHLGLLKARLAKLRTQLIEPAGAGPKGEGFATEKFGDARVAMVGFPSVGKSTLLSMLTGTESAAVSTHSNQPEFRGFVRFNTHPRQRG
jgi:predicted GTPase